MAKGFDPIELGEKLRKKLIKGDKVMLANFGKTLQAKDSFRAGKIESDYFRIKKYRKPGKKDYFEGEPAGIASVKLGIFKEECNTVFLAQVNACNLRCWYCYVDEKNLQANPVYGKWITADEMLYYFLTVSRLTQHAKDPNDRVNILRLSGGEAFLNPKLIYDTVQSIKKIAGLEKKLYLWADCNLATGDFFWKYLTRKQIDEIRNFKNLGICVCYKGFDKESFHYNTGAQPKFFNQQFLMHRRLIEEDFDVYSYIYPVSIFSATDLERIDEISIEYLVQKMDTFIRRLQKNVSYYAPLRVTLPYIKEYEANKSEISPRRKKIIELQPVIKNLWEQIIAEKYRYCNYRKLSLHQIPTL